MINPFQATLEHYYAAKNKYPVVWVTMLYGSQNYGLATENSDVDTKTLLIPTMKDVILGKRMVSTDLQMPDSSLNNVKDLRAMFQNYLKGNINFVETLFSDYFAVNPIFEKEFDTLRSKRDLIANANPRGLIRMAAGMANQKAAAMEHPFESKKEVLEKYGYDPKQLHHIARLYHFIENYYYDGDFASCLRPVPSVREYLMSLKTNPPSLEKAREIRDHYMAAIIAFVELADNNIPEDNGFAAAKEFLDDFAIDIITKQFKNELNNNALSL